MLPDQGTRAVMDLRRAKSTRQLPAELFGGARKGDCRGAGCGRGSLIMARRCLAQKTEPALRHCLRGAKGLARAWYAAGDLRAILAPPC
jgi:hypothetical protein